MSGSVALALEVSLSAFQRLFAPFLPFVCEEVWSWWQEGSVHRAAWPDAQQLRDAATESDADREARALELAADVLHVVRKSKSEARLAMRAPVERVVIVDVADRIDALKLAAGYISLAGSIESIESRTGDEFAVTVELADADQGD